MCRLRRRQRQRRRQKEALDAFSQSAPFFTSLLCLPFVLLQRRRRDLNKHMAPWGKQRDLETNKNASSESLSTTPNDDVNDDEQHERTKMNEQNQRSHSVAKAEMGEKTQPWTKQEDLKLQHMQEKYGNKWATVASPQLPDGPTTVRATMATSRQSKHTERKVDERGRRKGNFDDVCTFFFTL